MNRPIDVSSLVLPVNCHVTVVSGIRCFPSLPSRLETAPMSTSTSSSSSRKIVYDPFIVVVLRVHSLPRGISVHATQYRSIVRSRRKFKRRDCQPKTSIYNGVFSAWVWPTFLYIVLLLAMHPPRPAPVAFRLNVAVVVAVSALSYW